MSDLTLLTDTAFQVMKTGGVQGCPSEHLGNVDAAGVHRRW